MNNQQQTPTRNPFAPATGFELEENRQAMGRRVVIVCISGAVVILIACLLGLQFGLLIGRIGG